MKSLLRVLVRGHILISLPQTFYERDRLNGHKSSDSKKKQPALAKRDGSPENLRNRAHSQSDGRLKGENALEASLEELPFEPEKSGVIGTQRIVLERHSRQTQAQFLTVSF